MTVSVAVIALPFDNSLLMLQLNSFSASIQFPFPVSTNFSSGQVSFGTSTSLASDFVVDFVNSSLHCAESSLIEQAVASVITGVRPTLKAMRAQGAIFAFVPQDPGVSIDVCWSQAGLLDIISGKTIDVDGSWSALDASNAFDVNCVVLHPPDSLPTFMKRDASVAVVVVVGSTMVITASCNAPSLTVTWVISKHFDLEITNSSSGQSARFQPLPQHGGGKFRVCSLLILFLCNNLTPE